MVSAPSARRSRARSRPVSTAESGSDVSGAVRDSRIACVYEGTNGIQAQDLLFRKIAKDQGAALKEWLAEVGGVCARASGTPKDKVYVAMSQENKKAAPAAKEDDEEKEDTTTVWKVPVGVLTSSRASTLTLTSTVSPPSFSGNS